MLTDNQHVPLGGRHKGSEMPLFGEVVCLPLGNVERTFFVVNMLRMKMNNCELNEFAKLVFFKGKSIN
jgi:hypothetical protein